MLPIQNTPQILLKIIQDNNLGALTETAWIRMAIWNGMMIIIIFGWHLQKPLQLLPTQKLHQLINQLPGRMKKTLAPKNQS
jgi:hypothetical protein